MPRVKVYEKERKPYTIRLDAEVYAGAVRRIETLDCKTLQKYIERLITDDLLLAEMEAKKAMVAKARENK